MAEKSEHWSPYAANYVPIKVGSIDGTDVFAHDRGLIRASYASYRPNADVNSKPDRTLFVGRLHPDTKETDLEKVILFCL